MARNERKRQQKLARRKKKRSVKRAGAANAYTDDALLRQEVVLAAKLPIVYCSIPSQEQFDEAAGMGTVVLARGDLSDEVIISVFLVDSYCLGIKNAGLLRVSGEQFHEFVDDLKVREDVEACDPACAKKLVLDSIAYAKNLGFSPHKDYRLARLLFGSIDATACDRLFEFGHDGVPEYISGPDDSPAMIRRVLATLERSCGEGNYHMMVQVRESDLF